MYYVYVLKNLETGIFYKGFTKNLKRRIREHLSGNSAFTSKYKNWKLVYYEAFMSEIDARREEKFLKTGKGRERLKFLLSDSK